VNAAIKKALCRDPGSNRAWLSKMRPYWGHDYHFHVRIVCPADSHECEAQPAPPPQDGCGKELDSWFTAKPEEQPAKPGPSLVLANLPAACRQVLADP
jgi:penicillin-insensitive murein endopeptidase